MSSAVHVREIDIGSNPLFGATSFFERYQAGFVEPILPQQSSDVLVSRDNFGRWVGTPPSFTMRTTPIIGAQGQVDSLRISQNADVMYLFVGLVNASPHVFAANTRVPKGIHTARFARVNPTGLPQIISPWFEVSVGTDALDIDAEVKAGATAAGLSLSSFVKCVLILSLPIVGIVSSFDNNGSPVLDPVHPINGTANTTLAFAVDDHAHTFGETPLIARFNGEEYYGTLVNVGSTGDTRAAFRCTHGPGFAPQLGDAVEIVRYHDNMAFDVTASGVASPASINYVYSVTAALINQNAHAFTGMGGATEVYNVYCDQRFEVSADGSTWHGPFGTHLATYASTALHVRMTTASSGTCTVARYTMNKDPTYYNLVYDRPQVMGISTFGTAPVFNERAAIGPMILFADAYGKTTEAFVHVAALLHTDRSIICEERMTGLSLMMGEVSTLDQYAAVAFAFKSRTLIGSGMQDIVLRTPSLCIDAYPADSVAIGRDEGASGHLYISGALMADANVATAGEVRAKEITPVPLPTHMSVDAATIDAPTGVPITKVTRWLPEPRRLTVYESGGNYTIKGLVGTNPTIPALAGDTLTFAFVSGTPFTVYKGTMQQTLPLDILVPGTYTYKLGGVTRGQIVATAAPYTFPAFYFTSKNLHAPVRAASGEPFDVFFLNGAYHVVFDPQPGAIRLPRAQGLFLWLDPNHVDMDDIRMSIPGTALEGKRIDHGDAWKDMSVRYLQEQGVAAVSITADDNSATYTHAERDFFFKNGVYMYDDAGTGTRGHNQLFVSIAASNTGARSVATDMRFPTQYTVFAVQAVNQPAGNADVTRGTGRHGVRIPNILEYDVFSSELASGDRVNCVDQGVAADYADTRVTEYVILVVKRTQTDLLVSRYLENGAIDPTSVEAPFDANTFLPINEPWEIMNTTGSFGDVLVYNYAMTTIQVTEVVDFLKQKWLIDYSIPVAQYVASSSDYALGVKPTEGDFAPTIVRKTPIGFVVRFDDGAQTDFAFETPFATGTVVDGNVA